MGRYAVFIDGGYIRKVLKAFGGPRVCYHKLSDRCSGGDERLRTYYYDCAPYQSRTPTEDESQLKANFDRFVYALERHVPRCQVRLGRLARHAMPDGGTEFEQKKVDVLLAVDLVRLSCEKQIQRAVLFAGDSDYVPAISVAKDAGTIMQLYYSDALDSRPHDELLSACDDRFLIDQALIDAVLR